ncbi:hypothetical protein L7F22_026820 [Adiantum nelumboides]|nr:hypothetical protein [Adiantum nelumboides]
MESAMVLLLARLTGHNDIVYGLVVSLRALVEAVVEQAQSFVGPCLNTLAKRGTLQSNDSPSKLALALRDTHASCLMDNNALQPVERVQRWTGCEDKLFDALLSVNMPTESPEAPPTPPIMTAVATSSSSDLPLAVDVDVEQYGVTVTLSSSCIDEPRLATLAHDFERFCQLVLEGSTVSMGTLLPDVQYTAARRELGLDSVVVLTLAKLIRQKSGVKVGPVAVLRARTVQVIAELVRQGRRSSGCDRDDGDVAEAAYQSVVEALAREVGVALSEQQRAYLATPIQEGMLSATAAHVQDGGDTRQPYIYDHSIELTDEVCRADPERSLFRTAWATLVDKVDILRTTFHLTQDDKQPWLAIVHRSMPTACDGDAVELARCPAVWTVVPSTRRATLRMHHAVYDGASLPTLWAAFASEYAALLELTGSPTTVSPPFSTFAKQVAMQQDGAVRYWCHSLEGYTYEAVEKSSQTAETRHQVRTALDAPTTKHLRAQCQARSVTLQTALMLTWARVLAVEVLHQPDVVFGQVLGGSAQEASAGDMVGPTMNTLPIRIRLQGSLSDVLQAVQRTSEDAQQHQVASLRRIHKHWRNASPRPTPPSLFESLFVFDQAQSTVKHPHSLWNHVVESGGDQGGFAEYPLVISLHLWEGALQTRVSASSLLYQDRQPVQAIAEQFQALLSDLLSDTVGSKQLDAPPPRSRQLNKTPQSSPPPSLTPEQQGIAQEIIAAATMTLSGKEPVKVGLATHLFAVGLDSISAIRLSSQLRKSGVLLSVVDIMRAPIVSDLAPRLEEEDHSWLPVRI